VAADAVSLSAEALPWLLVTLLHISGAASATTLLSVSNTWVFWTALTALTEPRALWRRIARYPSPRQWVVLHSISKIYSSHWKPPVVSERMWSVNLDASISGVSDPRRAFLPAFRVTGSADEKPGSAWECRRHTWERWRHTSERRRHTWERRRHTWERRRHTWERRRHTWERWQHTWERQRHVWDHLESQSCIQFVFSSMYLSINIATHLHTLYLDCLRAVLDSNSRSAWKWWWSELRQILRGRDWASLEMLLEVGIECI